MAAEKLPPLRPRLSACTDLALADPRSCALFLDMDGTLLELAATPKSVRVPEGLTGLLERLSEGLDGAIAIVTGRLVSEVDRLLSPLRITASGVHGAEMRRSPKGEVERVSAMLPEDLFTSMQRLAGRIPGVLAESKGPGIAIHYRLAPNAEGEILAELEAILDRHAGAFELWPGKKIFEVIPSGLSKGTALAQLATLPAFRGRVPIMIGDDIGDEPAFAAAEGLSGFGLRVAGEHYSDDDADFAGPQAVLGWLDQFARKLATAEAVRSIS